MRYRILTEFNPTPGSSLDVDLTATIYACEGKIDSGYDFETGIRDIAASFSSRADFGKCLVRLRRDFAQLNFRTQVPDSEPN
jgi:hypothetical protein